jgi:formamidopyrimidine-DNA glycosylase
MPELPEVQTVVDTLRPVLLGASIVALHLHRQDIVSPQGTDLSRCCTGRSIHAIGRRGKRIVITLDDSNAFYIHLGMTGRLCLTRHDEPLPPHTHMVLTVLPDNRSGKQCLVRFTDPRRFGGIWWMGDTPCDEKMGPEPLGMTPRRLARQLSKTRRIIKSALLDQRVIAGLGNIYVDEALHRAHLHPERISAELTLPEVARLNRSIKLVLRRALRHKGSTLRDYVDAHGQPGDFTRLHRVYDRTGQPCLTCRTAIQRLVLGGRSTHFCPRCQTV